jgi:uncharacterized iron-regulated membrane protein
MDAVVLPVNAVVLLLILLVAFSAARLILWAWWIRTRNARMKKYDERWLKK